jgi:NitT/TauT family transport system permease protein
MEKSEANKVDVTNWSALSSKSPVRSRLEIGVIVLVAVVMIGGAELAIRGFGIPEYVLPTPSAIVDALISDFGLFWPHLLITLKELLLGYVIGASVGFIMAAI